MRTKYKNHQRMGKDKLLGDSDRYWATTHTRSKVTPPSSGQSSSLAPPPNFKREKNKPSKVTSYDPPKIVRSSPDVGPIKRDLVQRPEHQSSANHRAKELSKCCVILLIIFVAPITAILTIPSLTDYLSHWVFDVGSQCLCAHRRQIRLFYFLQCP